MTCPFCGKDGAHYRKGAHFDHEVRCPHCGRIWEPGNPSVWPLLEVIIGLRRELHEAEGKP